MKPIHAQGKFGTELKLRLVMESKYTFKVYHGGDFCGIVLASSKWEAMERVFSRLDGADRKKLFAKKYC